MNKFDIKLSDSFDNITYELIEEIIIYMIGLLFSVIIYINLHQFNINFVIILLIILTI